VARHRVTRCLRFARRPVTGRLFAGLWAFAALVVLSHVWCVFLWLSGGVRSCFAFSFPPMFAVDLSSQCVFKVLLQAECDFLCLKRGNFFFFLCFFSFFPLLLFVVRFCSDFVADLCYWGSCTFASSVSIHSRSV